MGSPDLFKALTQTLNGADAPVITSTEELTPSLSIVVAILYMMAVDGDISDRESSQLQSVIGADTATLRRAVNYASSHDIDQFLQEAPPLLNAKLRLCLLTNVCDSLMSDGVMAEVELALFDRLLQALGHTRISFQPFFDAIILKDRISIFGNFDDVPPAGQLTPPLMLVVSMLYMMSADGSLAEEEIGRLSAIVGSSQALLKAGLRYVGKVRAPQFLPLAAAALDERQRLCILLNACDAMMSDRQVLIAEEQLLRRMLDAFSVDLKSFDTYQNILRLKNDIPQEVPRARSTGESSAPRPASGAARTEGVVFERKRTWEEETGEAGKGSRSQRQKPGEASPEEGGESGLSSRISRTMQDNIDQLAGQFDDGLSLGTMAENARDGETHSGAGLSAPSASPESVRAYQDAAGAGSSEQHGNDGILVPGRHLKDAEASQSGKHWKDADGPQTGKHWKDADGPQTGKHWKDSEGSQAGQHWKDAEASQTGEHWRDAEGSQEGKHWKDADGSQPGQHHKDAKTSQPVRHWEDDAKSRAGKHWKDAAIRGKHRELSDTVNEHTGRHLRDDRKALDKEALEDDEGISLGEELLARMDAVEERTRTIRDYLDPLVSATSIAAASRLPVIPEPPPRPNVAASLATLRIEPQTNELQANEPQTNEPQANEPQTNEPQANASNDQGEISQPMLLASDEGGPIMTQSVPAANTEEAKMNHQLRVWSRVLLPVLFLTYGATMVGETISGHNFITNENLATDARTVHQMATVQQTVYRVTPEAVLLATSRAGSTPAMNATSETNASNASSASNASPAQALPAVTSGSVAAVNEAGLSDREKADRALEHRKEVLEAEVRRHQSASAIAAERQQWFAYAKSIVLLGLGMAIWGVLFRSMRTLHASTVAGIAGLLMTMNAHWLLLRF